MESVTRHSEPRRTDQRKRRRVEKACETCRRRKERCNGAIPTCSNCQAAARECLYSSETKRRGLPEGWVRALEKFWAVAILRTPGIDKDVVSVIKEGLRNPHKGGFAALWTDETNRKSLLKTWKASQLPGELETLLPLLERLPQRKMDEASPEGILPLNRDKLINSIFRTGAPLDATPANLEMREDTPTIGPAVSIHDHHFRRSRLPKTPDFRTLPTNALELIDAYFTWTHWFPILERHTMYRAYHQWSEQSMDSKSGDQACLLAIIAYQQVQRNSSNEDTVSLGSAASGREPNPLSTLVRDLIPTECRKCQLSHIQALLILCLTYLGAGFWDDAWLLVGQATRLALLKTTINVQHKRTSDTNIGSDRDRVLHILSGCFILDNLLSIVAAVPSHLRDRDVVGLGQLNEDGIEEWTPVAQFTDYGQARPGPAFTISTFNRLWHVTNLLSRVTRNMSSPVAELAQLQSVEADVLVWDNSQPAKTRLNQVLYPNFAGSVLPHHLTVHQVQLAVLIVVAAKSASLQPEASDPNGGLSNRLQQLTDLLMMHASDLDCRAIPPIWELILSIVLNEIENARKQSNIVVPISLIQTLESVVCTARRRWPIFDPLHARLQSHLGSSANPDNFLTQQSQQVSEIINDQARSTEIVRAQNAFPNEALSLDHFTLTPNIPFAQQNYEFNPRPSTDGMVDSIYTAGMTDAASCIPDFVTMDALHWDTSRQKSFQHLGFSEIENSNDGLQSFFRGM